jgi:hypothetical protein
MRRATAVSGAVPPIHVKLKRIAPMDTTLSLRARVTESTENTLVVERRSSPTEKRRRPAVAVGLGHPAYHRWE